VKLTVTDLDRFLAFAGIPDERHAAIRARFESGARAYDDTRIAKDANGAITASLALFPTGEAVLGLYARGELTAALVAETVARARELDAVSLHSFADPQHVAAFVSAGFRDLGERVEFKTPLEEMPDEDGTPLRWRAAGPKAPGMLAAVAEGDAHGEEERKEPERMLRVFGSDPELTSGDETMHIGSLDGDDVAFVMAQANREGKGWCRITYMGLVPAARGRGLGRWVHRHGFSMMRAQGGALYHGGTAVESAAMVRLFRAHGCREFRRGHIVEMRLSAPGGTPDRAGR